MARQLSLGLMAVCAVVVLRIFSRARSKASAEAAAAQLPAGAAPGGLLGPGEVAAEPFLMRRQIAHALKQNPEQVRQMFHSWIEEKE
jgi:hypothetical protein